MSTKAWRQIKAVVYLALCGSRDDDRPLGDVAAEVADRILSVSQARVEGECDPGVIATVAQDIQDALGVGGPEGAVVYEILRARLLREDGERASNTLAAPKTTTPLDTDRALRYAEGAGASTVDREWGESVLRGCRELRRLLAAPAERSASGLRATEVLTEDDPFTLMGFALLEAERGKREMPAYLFELAARICLARGDSATAARVREMEVRHLAEGRELTAEGVSTGESSQVAPGGDRIPEDGGLASPARTVTAPDRAALRGPRGEVR